MKTATILNMQSAKMGEAHQKTYSHMFLKSTILIMGGQFSVFGKVTNL